VTRPPRAPLTPEDAAALRGRILGEIRRLADAVGHPPGKERFARATGIPETQWSGRLWARWGDALTEAGFAPNALKTRFAQETMLEKLAEACRYFGHLPTIPEQRLYRRRDAAFPSAGAIAAHFGGQAGLLATLRTRATGSPRFADLRPLLATHGVPPRPAAARVVSGTVYLTVLNGLHKLGRADRFVAPGAQPPAGPGVAVLEHAIETDDPVGIEAYWQRRFAHRKVDSEWYRLLDSDLAAFRRRTYQ
jgi:hypothetical protein